MSTASHSIEYLKSRMARLEKSLSCGVKENERLQNALNTLDTELAVNKSMIDGSIDCIKTLDLDGNLMSMNKGGRTLLEIEDLNPLLGESWINFWKNEDHSKATKAVEEARQGRSGSFEGYCPTVNDRPKWWDVVVSPLYDENGNVSSLLSVSRDITEKKIQALELDKVHRSLKARMKELRCLYELSRLVEEHENIENILADFVKVLQKSFQHPERTAVRITHENKVFESGHFTETEAVLSLSIRCENVSAGKLDVAVQAEAFSQKEDPFFKEEKELMGVVSERLGHMIERLRRKESYSALFEMLNEAILKADPGGVITEANSAAAELCGYNTPQELIGTHMEKIYAHPETRDAIVIKLSGEGGSFHNFDFLLKRQDGTVVETSCNIKLLRDNTGEITGTLGALRDVTDIKHAERELRDSHRIAVESREKYKRVFDNETIMIMEVDADSFEIVNCNEAMAKNLGQRPENLMGKNIKDFLPANVLRERVAIGEKILNRNEPYTFEDENAGKYFLNTFTPVYLGKKRYIQTVTLDITERKRAEMARDKLVRNLEATLDKVKILSGLLPICASCKKIRDDKGYWNHLESYISKNSEALFSHSICPECAQKLYPEFGLFEE